MYLYIYIYIYIYMDGSEDDLRYIKLINYGDRVYLVLYVHTYIYMYIYVCMYIYIYKRVRG